MAYNVETLQLAVFLRDEATKDVERLRREIRGLNADTDRLNRSQISGNQRLQTSVGNLRKSYSDLHSMMLSTSSAADRVAYTAGTRLAQAMALGSAGITAWAVKSTSDIEQVDISLRTFVGDTVGKQLFGQLRELDRMSPFTFNELAGTTRQLAAFGVETGKIYDLTSSISEIASGSGRGVAGLQQLSLAVSQVASAGRLTGDEARQLSEFFNVYQVIGDVYGKTAGEVKKAIGDGATVPASVVLDAIAQQTGDLQRFVGLNEKQLNTLAGRWAAFKSDMTIAAAGSPGQPGAFADLTDGLKAELPILAQDLGDALRVVGPEMSRAALGALRMAEALIPLATPTVAAFFRGLGQFFEGATPQIYAMGDKAPDFAQAMIDTAEAIEPMIPDLVEFTGNMAELSSDILPDAIKLLAGTTHLLVMFANSSDAARYATGALLTVLLGYRAVSGVATTVRTLASAMDVLTAAESRNAVVGKFGVLGKLGLAGAGAYGLYEGATSKPGSAGSALGLIGGTTAVGAALGSVVPGIGTGLGALAGLGVGTAAYGFNALMGDPGGNAMSGHAAANAMSGGGIAITSGMRGWGVSGDSSGHRTGSAYDAWGSGMGSYAQNVRELGGYSVQHDSGSGLHVHSDWGDVPRMSGRSTGGGMVQETTTIYITATGQIDFEAALDRALSRRDRSKAVRG